MEVSRCSNWMVPNHSNRHHLFSTFNRKKCSPEIIYANMLRYPKYPYLKPELTSLSKAHNMFHIHVKSSGKYFSLATVFYHPFLVLYTRSANTTNSRSRQEQSNEREKTHKSGATKQMSADDSLRQICPQQVGTKNPKLQVVDFSNLDHDPLYLH